MQKLQVFGPNVLKGKINVSGSKNAALPILAASLLSTKKIFLKNLPKVNDIKTMIDLLKSLGSKVKYKKKTLIINNSKQNKKVAPYRLVKTMRAGILVLGPLLSIRFIVFLIYYYILLKNITVYISLFVIF